MFVCSFFKIVIWSLLFLFNNSRHTMHASSLTPPLFSLHYWQTRSSFSSALMSPTFLLSLISFFNHYQRFRCKLARKNSTKATVLTFTQNVINSIFHVHAYPTYLHTYTWKTPELYTYQVE